MGVSENASRIIFKTGAYFLVVYILFTNGT